MVHPGGLCPDRQAKGKTAAMVYLSTTHRVTGGHLDTHPWEGIQMNKMVKGSVVGASGVALLLGGFGTYALWSDSDTVAGVTVTSGELDINAGTATWSDVSADRPEQLDRRRPDRPRRHPEDDPGVHRQGDRQEHEGHPHLRPRHQVADPLRRQPHHRPRRDRLGRADRGHPRHRVEVRRPARQPRHRHRERDLHLLVSATTAQQAQNAAASIAASTFNLAQVRS